MSENKQTVDVIVAGGYKPSVIKLQKASPLKLISNAPMLKGAWTSFIPMP